jgi:hypothetical protein
MDSASYTRAKPVVCARAGGTGGPVPPCRGQP